MLCQTNLGNDQLSVMRNIGNHSLFDASSKATLALAIKAVSALMAFFSSIVLARVLGKDDYGIYVVVIAWVSIFGTLACLGYPQFIIRECSRDKEISLDVMRVSTRRVTAAGLIAIVFFIVMALSNSESPGRIAYLIAAPLPMIIACTGIKQSIIQSRKMYLSSIWPTSILAPAVVIAGVLALSFFFEEIAVYKVIAVYLFSAMCVYFSYSCQFHSLVRKLRLKRGGVFFDHGFCKVLPFMFLSSVYLIINRVDIIMLGLLASPDQVASYSVSARSAELLVFMGMTLVGLSAPYLSEQYKNKEFQEMQKLLRVLGVALIIVTIPPAILMVVFSEHLLTLFFGESYSHASVILKVLVVVQTVAVLGGPLGTLLNMTGLEKKHILGMAVSIIINIALNAFLIRPFGALGAAIATFFSILLSRVFLLYLVRKNLNLKPTAFGI